MKLLFYKIVLCLDNFINGIWSGFPICCILHYMRLESTLRAPNKYMMEQFDQWPKKVGHIGYVRCPYCILHNERIKEKDIRKGSVKLIHGIYKKIIKLHHGDVIKNHPHRCNNPLVKKYNNEYFCVNCGHQLFEDCEIY